MHLILASSLLHPPLCHTRSVVTLFNAVAKQQKQLEADAEAAGEVDSAAKKAKADGAVKNNFLRLLKNESAKVGGSGTAAKQYPR